MSFRTASAILRGNWLISPAYVKNNLALIHDLSRGKSVDLGFNERQEDELSAKHPLSAIKMADNTQYFNVGMYSSFDNVPVGSVAIVNLLGPVLKYGDLCSYGMVDKANLIQRIAASGKFKSIVLNVDSPGGQADGTQMLADVIKNLSIPVIAVVDDGMMASAAMWIGSACAEIYATKLTDTFGSIGVYTTLYDLTGYFEQMGVDVKEIYADQSTDKNKDYRDALAGDDTGIKESLNFLADTFINAVTSNRGSKLNTADENPFTGKMYAAETAQAIGLIDGILPFDEILTRAQDLGDNNLSINPNNQNSMFGQKFKSLSAIKGIAAGEVTAAHVAAVNSEISAEGINGVTLALDSELETASNAAAENTTALAAANAILGEGNHKPNLTEALAAISAASATAATNLQTVTTDRDKYQKLANQYGGLPADDHTNTTQEKTDEIEGANKPNPFYSQADEDLKQMRAAAGLKPKAPKK